MGKITQNTGIPAVALPVLDGLDLHCFWARFYDQPQYGYARTQFSDDTLCYFTAGSGWVRLLGRDAAPQSWQAPCLLLFRKTRTYAAQSPGAIQAYSMHFRCELAGKPPVSLMDLLDLPAVLPGVLTGTVGPRLMAMAEAYLQRRLGSQWMLEGHLRLLLADMIRAVWPAGDEAAAGGSGAVENSGAARSNGTSGRAGGVGAAGQWKERQGRRERGLLRLAPALAYMNEHLREAITIAAVADAVGLTAGHFTAAFKRTFQTTPAQYLIELRIDRARRLLLTSELTVNEIAHELGFGYPHYFIRRFKQSMGQTPAAWRAANAR